MAGASSPRIKIHRSFYHKTLFGTTPRVIAFGKSSPIRGTKTACFWDSCPTEGLFSVCFQTQYPNKCLDAIALGQLLSRTDKPTPPKPTCPTTQKRRHLFSIYYHAASWWPGMHQLPTTNRASHYQPPPVETHKIHLLLIHPP